MFRDTPNAFRVRETFADGSSRIVTHHFFSREVFESQLHWLNIRDRGFRSHEEERAAATQAPAPFILEVEA
jgi:hypothetical protein